MKDTTRELHVVKSCMGLHAENHFPAHGRIKARYLKFASEAKFCCQMHQDRVKPNPLGLTGIHPSFPNAVPENAPFWTWELLQLLLSSTDRWPRYTVFCHLQSTQMNSVPQQRSRREQVKQTLDPDCPGSFLLRQRVLLNREGVDGTLQGASLESVVFNKNRKKVGVLFGEKIV